MFGQVLGGWRWRLEIGDWRLESRLRSAQVSAPPHQGSSRWHS